MSDCIFCAIVAGTMPSERVYEDDRTVAFLDIFPAADGHVLVIPRVHADNIHSADPADVAAVAQAAQIIAGRVSGALASDGVTITQANGPAAGQTVFHYHVHVIPRFDGDGVLNPWKPGHSDAEDLSRIGTLLRGE
jgi:histidine triad (HIT) family protein